MKTLTIFHDPQCGLCAAFKEWLNRQPKYVEARFIPYNAPAAARLFPGLQDMGAGKDVVVLADDGSWWQGETAWLTCLWITREYRPWSYRFKSPLLRPLVKRVIHLLAENRLTISRLLHLRHDEQLAQAIRAQPQPRCQTGTCQIDSPIKFHTPHPHCHDNQQHRDLRSQRLPRPLPVPPFHPPREGGGGNRPQP